MTVVLSWPKLDQVTTKLPSASMPTSGVTCQLSVVWLTRNSVGVQGRAGGVVAPGVDAVAAAVLAEALPGDYEVAGGVHGHGRVDPACRGCRC